jgi:hypothetical protein
MNTSMSEFEKLERNLWSSNVTTDRKIRNMREVLSRIAENIAKGKSTSDLEKETGLHRDTIHLIGKELMQLGLVEKKGHFGNYRLTPKAYQNHAYLAQRLIGGLLRDISFRNQYISLNNSFCCEALIQKFDYLISQDPKFFNDKMNLDEMNAILIYEFSNRIGALITYLTIQVFQKTIESVLDRRGTVMDKLALDWLNNTIKPHVIILEFIRLMNHASRLIKGKDLIQQTERSDRNAPKLNLFENEREREYYDSLNDAFERVYPDLSYLINNIRDQELFKIKTITERRKYYLCMPHKITVEVTEGVKYFRCPKCGFSNSVCIPNIVTNQKLILVLNRKSKERIKLSDRKKCAHIWIRSTLHPDPTETIFECVRCLRWLTLPAESKEKLDKIDKAILLKFKTQNDRLLCKQVQNFFYDRSNEEHSIISLSDYVKSYYNKSPDLTSRRERNDHDIFDASTITKKLESVLRFLVDQDFLRLVASKSTKNDSLSQTYIHKNLTNWR